MKKPALKALAIVASLWHIAVPAAQTLHLPTPSKSLLQPGGETRFYAPTPGRDWVSGTYGCVRSDGHQFHEGIDILRLNTDRRGEPTDLVTAIDKGIVEYVNTVAGRSNYGRYVVLRHHVEGVAVYSLYAHLSSLAEGLRAGSPVAPRQILGVMGRSTNTRTPIDRGRAHLHLEIALKGNEHFDHWFQATYKGSVNEHGNWNGRNLLGIDPTEIFRRQQIDGARFSLLNLIRNQKEMFRVLIPRADFSYTSSYRPLMRRNPVAEKEGIVAVELLFNFAGLPFQMIPRARSEIEIGRDYRILSVDEEYARARSCRGLIRQSGGAWQLTRSGRSLLDLITYR
jgi:murein DD-endopeptidase MepM/ murein hydrolase activator NlpD